MIFSRGLGILRIVNFLIMRSLSMLKSDWIKLINAIRLRKKEYNGTDGDIHYSFYYKKTCANRGYGERGDMVDLSYDECNFGLRYKGYNFSLTCVYGHAVCCRNPKYDIYDLVRKSRKN